MKKRPPAADSSIARAALPKRFRSGSMEGNSDGSGGGEGGWRHGG